MMRGGIDLGGTKIQVVVIDDDHQVHGQVRHPTPVEGGPQAVAEEMVAAVREAAEQAGVEPGSLKGIGVGSPGEIDEATGTVAEVGNVAGGWQQAFALGPALSHALGTDVRVDNDVRVGAQAEVQLGAGRDFQSMLAVWWGTGVGGSVVLDRTTWLGRDAAGEIGHTVIQHLGGRRCPCGRRGCLEAYSGRSAMENEARRRHRDGEKTKLFKLMRKHDKDRLTSGIWKRALDRDDALARSLLDEAVDALGAGIASAINLLDLEAVILGGGLGTKFGEPFARRIEQAMVPHLFVEDRRPQVRVAELGDLGGAIGASLLVDGH
jgi:glucokinase